MSQYLVDADHGRAQHRGPAPQRGRRRAGATGTSRRSPWPTGTPVTREEVAVELAVRLRRRLAADRLAGRVRRARRQGLRRDRAGPAAAGALRVLAAGAGALRAGDQRARASSPPATYGWTR